MVTQSGPPGPDCQAMTTLLQSSLLLLLLLPLQHSGSGSDGLICPPSTALTGEAGSEEVSVYIMRGERDSWWLVPPVLIDFISPPAPALSLHSAAELGLHWSLQSQFSTFNFSFIIFSSENYLSITDIG